MLFTFHENNLMIIDNVARCLSLVFNVVFTYVFLGRTTSLLTCSTLLIVMIGFVSGVQGEIGIAISLLYLHSHDSLPLQDSPSSALLRGYWPRYLYLSTLYSRRKYCPWWTMISRWFCTTTISTRAISSFRSFSSSKDRFFNLLIQIYHFLVINILLFRFC